MISLVKKHADSIQVYTNAVALIKFLFMLYEETELQTAIITNPAFSTAESGPKLRYLDHDKLPDRILWEAFKEGDELAFISIYKGYSKILYDHGCKYSSDKEMVRDCLQDFFIYLRKNRRGFCSTGSIKYYLSKAFKRRVIEYTKKNSCNYKLHELVPYYGVPSELSIESTYINKQVKAEQLEKLNKALTSLDYKELQAIYFFYYKGLSYEQIAERFNYSHVSSARRVMYRGLKQLRNCLALIKVDG